MSLSKPERLLQNLNRVVQGDYRISRRGVPHIVVNNFHSIAYFGKSKLFRIFDNYASGLPQNVIDFKHPHEVVNYFKSITNE